MKKTLTFLLICSLLLSFPSCAPAPESVESFYMMDTVITVTLYAEKEDAAPIFAECRAILSELDALWSRTREGSDTARFNASQNGLDDLDPRTVDLIEKALFISEASEGAFDITVLPVVELWASCEKADRLPTEEELSATLETVNYQNLKVTSQTSVTKAPGTRIDLGGIGKGAAMSTVMDYLKTTDILGGVISFGSNVAVFGKKPDGSDFRIALRDPKDPQGYSDIIALHPGEILSVSGDYERYFTIGGKQYHHILDPKTGYPSASGFSSVAVITDDGALADALSTTVMIVGYDGLREFLGDALFPFDAVCVKTDGEVVSTLKP